MINSEGFPCRSVSSLGALEGAGICTGEFVPQRRRNRRPRRFEIWDVPPLGSGLKTTLWNGLGHNRSKFQEVRLKSKAFILTVRDPSSHVCQIVIIMAGWGDLKCGSFCFPPPALELIKWGD